MPKVSIIIPVHNSEKYLRECLDSVIEQNLQDIEFLCINDDSIDSTSEILEEYAATDDRFRLIYDPSSSYGHKINRGITEASGKYIGIVESDDKIQKDMFSTLYMLADKYQVDYIKSDFYSFIDTSNGSCKTISAILSDKALYGKVLDITSHPMIIVEAALGIWTGIYNKDFLRKYDIKLNETPGASYQDTGFSFLTAIHAKRVFYLNKPFYWYRLDNTSSSVKDQNKSMAIVEEIRLIKDNIPKGAENEYEIRSAYYLRKFMAYWWNIRRLSENNRIRFVEDIMNDINIDINNNNIDLDKLNSSLANFYKSLQEDPFTTLQDLKQQENYIEDRYTKIIRLLELNKDIVIFGAGNFGERMIGFEKLLRKSCIKCLCDNNSELWGGYRHNFPVFSPDIAIELYPDAYYIIANIKSKDDIRNQLQKMNVEDEKIINYDFLAREDQVLLYYTILANND